MATATPLPPTRHHSTRAVSPDTALALLSTYIANAADDPSLQPNALITDHGPISSNSGSSTGLTMHNLKRVEAGLKGEHLGADANSTKTGGEDLPDLQMGGREGRERDGEVNGVLRVGDGDEGDEETVGGPDEWQDMQAYEREQEMTVGEVGARHNGIQDGGEVPRVKESTSVQDKAKRKRDKAKRRRKERRELSEKKASDKAAEL